MALSPREPQSTKQGTANPAMADQTGDVANAYSGMVASPPVVRAFGVIQRYREIECDGLAQHHHLHTTPPVAHKPIAEKDSRPICMYETSALKSPRFCLGRSKEKKALIPFRSSGYFAVPDNVSQRM